LDDEQIISTPRPSPSLIVVYKGTQIHKEKCEETINELCKLSFWKKWKVKLRLLFHGCEICFGFEISSCSHSNIILV